MSRKDGPAHKLLWQHKDPPSTRMYEFKTMIENKYNVKLETYESLHQWSITSLPAFWEQIWHFTQVRASKPFVRVRSRHIRSFEDAGSVDHNLGPERGCTNVTTTRVLHRCPFEFC